MDRSIQRIDTRSCAHDGDLFDCNGSALSVCNQTEAAHLLSTLVRENSYRLPGRKAGAARSSTRRIVTTFFPQKVRSFIKRYLLMRVAAGNA